MSNSGRASWDVMFRVLMRMQFARPRRNWRPYVIVSAVMPAGIVLLLYFVNDPSLKAGAWIWTPPQFQEPLQALGFGFSIRPIRGC
ncbi:MAG: hypothetical protein M1596_00540 [Firmicutes bacterium]|nr:hypothetical protein [Bacillota bacterium]